MKPNAIENPKGKLLDAINRDFGSIDALRSRFDEAGARLFGSGWVWLVSDRQKDRKLDVITTTGHDHPLMQDRSPILLNDVWEHAYYLKYESRCADYLKAWWALVDWDEAARCFDLSDNSSQERWEEEGGNLPPAAG